MDPLNDVQLEAAARKLCQLRAIDPDAGGSVDFAVGGRAYPRKNWQDVADQLRGIDLYIIALDYARSQQ